MEMPGAVVQTVLVPDMMSEKRLVLTANKKGLALRLHATHATDHVI